MLGDLFVPKPVLKFTKKGSQTLPLGGQHEAGILQSGAGSVCVCSAWPVGPRSLAEASGGQAPAEPGSNLTDWPEPRNRKHPYRVCVGPTGRVWAATQQ